MLTGRVALASTDHGEKLHDVPDEDLKDVMVVAKKIAVAQGLVDYNILQVSTPVTHPCIVVGTAHTTKRSFPLFEYDTHTLNSPFGATTHRLPSSE